MKSMANITSLLVCTTLFLAGGCDKAVKENIAEKTNPSFLKLAKDRFSVRYYAKTPVEQEKIDAILEAARVAPTAKNLQPFHIYVLKSEEAIASFRGARTGPPWCSSCATTSRRRGSARSTQATIPA